MLRRSTPRLEVVKTLGAVEGVDLGEYQRLLLERFSNIYIKDKLARLAQDGSQKFMNTLRDALLGYRTQLAFMQEVTPHEPPSGFDDVTTTPGQPQP